MAGWCWTEVETSEGPMARSSHGLSVIGDTLYLLGGEYTARSPLDSTLHALDLKPGQVGVWREVEVAGGDPPSPRFGHGQASVGECIYVFGGRAGTQIDEQLMNDLHEFNTRTREWRALESAGPAPCPRSFHRMVALGSTLYVFGGCPAEGRLADLHCFNLATSTWSRLPDCGMEGRGGAGLAVAGGRLLVLGGFAGREMADCWQFCPSKEEWTKLEPELSPARSVTVCLGLGSRVLLFGGELEPSDRGHEGAGNFSAETLLLDTKGAVEPGLRGAGPEARGWSAGAAWGKTRALVVGGLAGGDDNPRRLMDVWLGELEG